MFTPVSSENVHIDIISDYIYDAISSAKKRVKNKIVSKFQSAFGLLSEFPWEVCVGLWDHVWYIVMFMYRRANHLLT